MRIATYLKWNHSMLNFLNDKPARMHAAMLALMYILIWYSINNYEISNYFFCMQGNKLWSNNNKYNNIYLFIHNKYKNNVYAACSAQCMNEF